MNIPKIEEAIILLYQTFIEDQNVATQRGIAITAMNKMVKLLGGDDVVEKIEAVPYSARLRAKHLFEDESQPKAEKQEPKAWMSEENDCLFFDKDKPNPMNYDFWTPLYTHSQHRKQLMGKEIDAYLESEWTGYSSYHDCFKEIVRWTEAKHDIKE